MSEFEPGEGWREVSYVDYCDEGVPADRTATIRVGDQNPRYFVREDLLPTEPYTVIRTGPMRWMKCGLYFHPNGTEGNRNAWMLLVHESQTERRAITAAGLQVQCVYDVKSVREQVSEFGFEVLTEPIAREFGVQA